MSYLITAYVVTIGAIGLYWLRAVADRRQLCDRESDGKPLD